MIRLYDFPLSGNAHKVRNLLSLLGLEFERVDVDLAGGEQRSPGFLARNPFGQVPVLVDGDFVVRDSGAILVYLARKFGRGEWLPIDAEGEARVQEWLATASTRVADGPARIWLMKLFDAPGDIDAVREQARDTLERIEAHLEGRRFLAVDRPTIADIANHSYIAMSPSVGLALDAYPNVRAWIERLEKLPGFYPVPRPPEAA